MENCTTWKGESLGFIQSGKGQAPTETNNLAEKYPEKVEELDNFFEAWKNSPPEFSGN